MSDLMWRGKRLDDMSREELIEALDWALRENLKQFEPQAIHERALGRVEAMRRRVSRPD